MTGAADSWRGEIRATLDLSWPLVAAFAGNQLLSLVDTVVAGHLGTIPLAAVGLGGSLFFFGSILAMGVLMGLDPLAAQAVGAGEPHIARRHLREAVRLAVKLSLPSMGIIALAYYGGLWAVGVEPDTRAEAGWYLLARSPSVLPFLLFITLRSYLQAMHIARPVFVGMLVANAVNVPANLYFAVELGWGVGGIGLASTLVMTAQAGVLAWVVRRIPVPEGTGPPTEEGTRQLIRVGWPIGLHFLAEMGVFATVTVLMGGLGSIAVAGHQVALQLAAFTFTVCLGVSAATSVRVGNAVGRRDPDGTLRAGLVGMGTGLAFMSCTAIAFLLLAPVLAGAMTEAPEVIELAVPLLYVAAAFQVFDGIQAVAAGALRGAGDTRTAMWVTVVGHWCIGLPIGVLCTWGLDYGPRGLWFGLTAGLATSGTALALRFVLTARHVVRVSTEV